MPKKLKKKWGWGWGWAKGGSKTSSCFMLWKQDSALGISEPPVACVHLNLFQLLQLIDSTLQESQIFTYVLYLKFTYNYAFHIKIIHTQSCIFTIIGYMTSVDRKQIVEDHKFSLMFIHSLHI